MLEILCDAEANKLEYCRHSLSLEDQLLLTLNYLRNYPTQLELSACYQIAERALLHKHLKVGLSPNHPHLRHGSSMGST